MKLCLAAAALLFLLLPLHAQEPPAPAPAAPDIAALKAELERLKGMVPDQSHAMKDVAYHFTNLWFAVEKANWPLADFYLAETRSHLKWAVRIIPVRKTPGGGELRLAELLEPMDKGVLTALKATLAAKDAAAFCTQYEQALATCYGCHVAAGKPFLQLHVPARPEVEIVNFEPVPSAP